MILLSSYVLFPGSTDSHELAIALQVFSLFFFVGCFFADLFFAAALGTSVMRTRFGDHVVVKSEFLELHAEAVRLVDECRNSFRA